MSSWPRVPLGDLVVEERTQRSESDAPVWNLNLDQIEPDTGRVLERVRVPQEDLGPSTYPFAAGTVLYSKLRPYLNKVVVADEPGFATTELVPLRCKPQKAMPDYIAYFLRSAEFLSFANTVVAGAKMPRMVMSEFWKYQVPLPPLDEQRRIAAILDKADALRTKRREALAQLDRLTQSIFVAMFGDPEVNELRLPVAELQDLCSRVTDGTHQSPTWEQSGIPFLFISNIVGGKVTFDTDKFISRETYEELTRRCRIEAGDVLYTTVGSYGNTAIVDGQREFCFQRHIAHIKPNPGLLDSVFCAVMLESNGVRRQVDRCARGVAQKTVNLSDLKTLRVFAPPIEMQREFRRRAEAALQIKDLHLQAMKHDEALFVSLQDRAFRGDL